jgi:hypothetical protein
LLANCPVSSDDVRRYAQINVARLAKGWDTGAMTDVGGHDASPSDNEASASGNKASDFIRVFAPRLKRTRSAVTNGGRPFVDGDGNSAWYRRRRDILELHLDDMGGRGCLSESQISLAGRAASIEVELEQMEGKLSKGETVDLDSFTRAASHLRRILETLGVARAQRDITIDLRAIVAEPNPDLTQFSAPQLDRLYRLLAEARMSAFEAVGEAVSEATDGYSAYEAGERSRDGEMAAHGLPEGEAGS